MTGDCWGELLVLQEASCVWFYFISLQWMRSCLSGRPPKILLKVYFTTLVECTVQRACLFSPLLSKCFYFVDRLDGCQRTCDTLRDCCPQNLLFLYTTTQAASGSAVRLDGPVTMENTSVKKEPDHVNSGTKYNVLVLLFFLACTTC